MPQLAKCLDFLKSHNENKKTLQFRQLNAHKTQYAKKKLQYGTDPDLNTASATYMINY